MRLLIITNLVQLIALTILAAWFVRVYLVDLPNHRTYVISTFESNLWVGRPFPEISLEAIQDTFYTDFSKTHGGLVILINASFCEPCLKQVLNAMQHVHDHLNEPAQLPVYAISSAPAIAEKYARALKLKYRLGTVLSSDDGTYVDLFERTPVVFLVDSHQNILQCHIPIYRKEQFTQLFFWKLVTIHLPALEVSTRSFVDSPLNKLEGLSLLDVISGHYTHSF